MPGNRKQGEEKYPQALKDDGAWRTQQQAGCPLQIIRMTPRSRHGVWSDSARKQYPLLARCPFLIEKSANPSKNSSIQRLAGSTGIGLSIGSCDVARAPVWCSLACTLPEGTHLLI